MSQPTVLVTGATGKTGAAVVRELLARNLRVRALVRVDDDRSQALRRLGVQPVVADLYDPIGLTKALDGVQRAYFVPVFRPYMIQSATAFATAAESAGLEHVVQLSQWLSSPRHPSNLTRQTWLVDRLLSRIPGVGHTILNPGMFADNFLRTIDMPAHLGLHPVLTGSSRSAPVSNEDIARVAAAILADPTPHRGKVYRPTGPRLLSGADVAACLSRVLGRSVRPVPVPFWLFTKVARAQGVHPFEISSYRHYMTDHRAGAFEAGGGVTDVVERLTGSPAEDFETTARRYALLPAARRSVSAALAAWGRFLVAPALPGYNLDRWDSRAQIPRAIRPAV
ncbi:MAG: NmrA family NAD(P)-binding protein [Planctomycetota bacterium]|nr:NmrA family NAD(P)-binding protein [Planctomycetota bacterium]